MEDPNTSDHIEFTPRSERRRRQFPLSRLLLETEGAARRLIAVPAFAVLLVAALMLFVASEVDRGPLSPQVAEAAPVTIVITNVTPQGGGNFLVQGTWDTQTCWAPGNEFHGYIIVYTDTSPAGVNVPLVTFTDSAPTNAITSADAVGSADPDFLGDILPAPCNGGSAGPLTGTNREANNVAWSITVQLDESAYICAAVLHQTVSGNDADATDCTNSIISVDTAFHVFKDFSNNSSASVTITLDCGAGATEQTDDGTATDTPLDSADFTVTVASGSDPTCTATETTIPAGYTASGTPAGTCSALLSVGSCTITNTLNSATFTVNKDFVPNSAANVSVTLTCGTGTVTGSNPRNVSEAAPGVFVVTGITAPSTTCTATETVPGGYTDSSNCTSVTLLANGTASCTITNTQNSATFTVNKVYVGGNGPAVSISLDCGTGSEGGPHNADDPTPDASFTVTGITAPSTTCSATEGTPPDGYAQTASDCTNVTLNANGTASCTITNSKLPTISVQKICVPSNATQAFVISGAGSITSIDCGETDGPVAVNPGNYNVTETQVQGWDTPQYQGCADSDLTYGETLTCVITNNRLPTLTVDKVCVGSQDGSFNISTTGTLTGLPASITCSQDPIVLTDDDGTTYNITETVPAGWQAGSPQYSADCSGTLEYGDVVTCTITNVKLGALEATKTCDPAEIEDQAFTFSLAKTSAPNTVLDTKTVDCDTTEPDGATNPSVATFSNLAPDTYVVTETAVTGYTTDVSGCASEVVAAGQTASCTITNTLNRATVTVSKTNADGSTEPVVTFGLSCTGSTVDVTPATDTATPGGDDAEFSVTGMGAAGSDCTLTETVPTGWNAEAFQCQNNANNQSVNDFTAITDGVTFTVFDGDVIVCSVRDVKEAGKVTIIKDVLGGTDEQDFSFDYSGTPSGGSFDLDDDGSNVVPPSTLSNTEVLDLQPGTYDITEDALSGWLLEGDIECTGTTSEQQITGGVRVTVVDLSDITCTFVNNKQEASLTVIKDALPADGTNFEFDINLNLHSFTLDDAAVDDGDAFDNSETFTVAPGDYEIIETLVTGWKLTSVVCTVNGQGIEEDLTGNPTVGIENLTIADGDSVTCTFTNDKQEGTVKIVKQTTPDGDSTSFGFSGPTAFGNFNLTDGGENQKTLPVGTNYVFSETVPSDWDLTGVTCSGGTGDYYQFSDTASNQLTVDVADGENIVCTFNNALQGSIKVIKTCEEADFTDELTEGFTFSIGTEEEDVAIACDGESQVYYLDEGDYTVSEDLNNSQYELVGIDCDPITEGNQATVGLENGDVVVCEITNEPYVKIIVNKSCEPLELNTDDFTISLTGGNLGNAIEQEVDCGQTDATYFVPAGNYSVGEEEADTNTFEYLEHTFGGDCDSEGDVTVAAGGVATCTLLNSALFEVTVLKSCGEEATAEALASNVTFTFSLYEGDDVEPIESVSGIECGEIVTFDDIPAVENGSYYVIEELDELPIGWSQLANNCEDLVATNMPSEGEGDQERNCTITNGFADPAVGKVVDEEHENIVMQGDIPTVREGLAFEYIIRVINLGDAPGDFLLEDYDLTNATIITVLESYDNVACVFAAGETSFDCDVTDLPAGDFVDIVVAVQANETCDPINNSARVSYLTELTEEVGTAAFPPEFDGFADDVQAVQVNVYGCDIDLDLTKGQREGDSGGFTTTTLAVEPGDEIQYRIVIRNDGDVTLTDVVIEDPISDDLTLTDIVSDPDDRCDIVGADLVCDGFDLEPGQTYTVIIEVEVEECDLITNRANGDAFELGTQQSNAVQLNCEIEGDDEPQQPAPSPTPVNQVGGTQTQPQPQPRISEVLPTRLPATGTGGSIESGNAFADYAVWGGIAMVLALLGLALGARKVLGRQR